MTTLRLGLLGCGGMNTHHARVFTNSVADVDIVALCDPNPQSLARCQQQVFDPVGRHPETFADYRQMLDRARLDGVVIGTPHTQHFDQTMAALDRRLHVLLEKPMVTSVDHARRLVARAAETGDRLSLAFPGPYSPEFQYVRALKDRGDLGDVTVVDAFVGQHWRQPTAGTWRQDPALSGGGQAYDSGAHLFNGILWLTGLRPAEVFAHCDNRETPVDINTAAVIRLENGALVTACVAGDDRCGWDSWIHISATKATVRTAIHGGKLEHWTHSGRVPYPPVTPVPSLQQTFADSIRGAAPIPCPPIWGLRQALLMDALYQSARTGHPVLVPSD